jgi:hypothetical protein
MYRHLNMIPIARDWHGYEKTRGVSKTGSADTGTVVDFGTPRHTTYLCRGITGIHGVAVLPSVSATSDSVAMSIDR